MKYLVITTINPASVGSIAKLRDFLVDWQIVVVGDKKTPLDWRIKNVIYLSIEDQEINFSDLSRALPFNSYARKNLGYLYAIRNGASVIAETDDDNYAYPDFLQNISKEISGCSITGEMAWVNVYSHFTDQWIWPRGFSLKQLLASRDTPSTLSDQSSVKESIIQQYLADGDSDVDAIYRLTVNKDVKFKESQTVFLEAGQVCPFNSQNTIWMPEAFPLLYLPSYVSFRMTDIWRSFIAQTCVYAASERISFSSSTMYQTRNIHDFLKDFEQEIPGYLQNELIIDCLMNLNLLESKDSYIYNLHTCYEALHIKLGLITKPELELLDIWIREVSA